MSDVDKPEPRRELSQTAACVICLLFFTIVLGPIVLANTFHSGWWLLTYLLAMGGPGLYEKLKEPRTSSDTDLAHQRSSDSLGETGVRGHRSRGGDRGHEVARTSLSRGSAVDPSELNQQVPTVKSVADPGLVQIERPDGSVWSGYVGPPVKLNDPRRIDSHRVQVDIDNDLRWVSLQRQLRGPVLRSEHAPTRVRTAPRRREGPPVWEPGAEDSPVDERGRFRPGNAVAASRQRDEHGRFVPKASQDVPQDAPSRPASQEDTADA